MSQEKKSNYNAILIVSILIGFFILLILVGGGCYLITQVAKNIDQATQTTQTKPGWSTYQNSRWPFTVNYPNGYSKEESVNGDGATFTSPDGQIELRAFAVLAAGSTQDQYLASILDLARHPRSGINFSVRELSSQPQNFKNATGTMKTWQYESINKGNVEVRIAAESEGNMYNLSMTAPAGTYTQSMSMFRQMAESFDVQK